MEEKIKNAPIDATVEKAEELSDEMLENVAGGCMLGNGKESHVDAIIRRAKERSERVHSK